jgi:hypothetical protein
MTRWLGERLTAGQSDSTSDPSLPVCCSRSFSFTRFLTCSTARPCGVVNYLRSSDRVHQRRKAPSVGPAESRQRRACCHASAKAPPLRRRVPSSCPHGRPLMVGSCRSPRNHTSRFRGEQNGDDSNHDRETARHLDALGHLHGGPFHGWLTSLDATVHGVNIRNAD